MALTTYGRTDALTVNLWARKLAREALKETFIYRFIGTTAASLIMLQTDLSKGPGDKVTYGLRVQLIGDGVSENQVLEGNEEALTTYADSLLINELMHAVRVRNKGTIDAQRVTFDMRSEARDGLKDWFANRFDQCFANHVCGYTAETRPLYLGNNAAVAPSSGTAPQTRILRGGGVANDQSCSAVGQQFDLTLLDKAKEIALTTSPLIRPLRIAGGEYYVCFLHPSQVTTVRTSTSSGQWLDIQRAAMQGGMITQNPIFTGALGVYNGVILYEWARLTQGQNSGTGVAVANTRRAVFAGAQAAMIGFGQRYTGQSRFSWVEKTFDYERELGVSGKTVWGMKKTVFNALDFGSIVITTYAVAAS